jgi:hypothetical protein
VVHDERHADNTLVVAEEETADGCKGGAHCYIW